MASSRVASPGRMILWPAVVLLVVAAVGAPYYVLPHAQQLRHPFHPWFRSSGYVGQSAGIVTFFCFLFMWLFPVRKKLRRLEWLGPVPKWLNAHIGVGLVLPLVGAIHASFHFNGVIGLGYIAMLIVCVSGVVGRYLYVRIPRSRTGVELGLGDVAAQQRSLLGEIADASGLSILDIQEILKVESVPAHVGILRAFVWMARDDIARVRAARRLRARLSAGKSINPRHVRAIMALARREMSLNQQTRLLNVTHSIFQYWHAAHRPVAITAFIAVTIHVIVVVAVGATWF